MTVNFMGVVRCCKAFLPIFKQQVKKGTHAGGRIVNLASMAGKATCCGNLTAYSASKHAVVAFSHGLRIDLAPFGIEVGTMCPTFHGTPMVKDAGQSFDGIWKTLPKHITEEYGEGTFPIQNRRVILFLRFCLALKSFLFRQTTVTFPYNKAWSLVDSCGAWMLSWSNS